MNTSTATQTGPEREVSERLEGGAHFCPPANISANSDEYVLEIEMPGVPKDGIEIKIEGGQLRIEGKRPMETGVGEVYYRERAFGNCRRVFELATDIDTSKITARLDQGILTVHLPKTEEVKPRKIEVSG